MTLRIVSDNVSELPVDNWSDISGMLRRTADEIDEGKYGDIIRLVAILDQPMGIGIQTFGENGSQFEIVGLIEAAKIRILADDALED